jgi:hypothetical protein
MAMSLSDHSEGPNLIVLACFVGSRYRIVDIQGLLLLSTRSTSHHNNPGYRIIYVHREENLKSNLGSSI